MCRFGLVPTFAWRA
ncbi:hypothetical protein LINPERPRIM_LOCUS11421 [Linum perenne]